MSRQSIPRGVPDDGAVRLEPGRRACDRSVDSMAEHPLREELAADERLRRLRRYVTWSQEELVAFSEALQSHRRVDAEVWR